MGYESDRAFRKNAFGRRTQIVKMGKDGTCIQSTFNVASQYQQATGTKMRNNSLHGKINSDLWDLESIEKDYRFVYALGELFPEGSSERDKIARTLVRLKNEKANLLKKWWAENHTELK